LAFVPQAAIVAPAVAPEVAPDPAVFPAPFVDPPSAPAPGKWKTLLSYTALVFFSAFLALFMAEATDPVRGFLPFVLDPPPAHSAPRGFEASFGVSRLYARSAVETPRPLVPNSGDTFQFAPAEGLASWYGYDHIGRKTADGGWFDPEALTAAHRSLPFGTIVRVTRLSTGRTVEVTINDRGPYIEGRIVDLPRANSASKATALPAAASKSCDIRWETGALRPFLLLARPPRPCPLPLLARPPRPCPLPLLARPPRPPRPRPPPLPVLRPRPASL
jgi:hypothetical protein